MESVLQQLLRCGGHSPHSAQVPWLLSCLHWVSLRRLQAALRHHQQAHPHPEMLCLILLECQSPGMAERYTASGGGGGRCLLSPLCVPLQVPGLQLLSQDLSAKFSLLLIELLVFLGHR